MKYSLIFLVFLILSCTKEDEIVSEIPPECDFLGITQTPDRLKIIIDSSEDQTTICRTKVMSDVEVLPTECWTITREYYNCISMAYYPQEIFLVFTDTYICSFQAN